MTWSKRWSAACASKASGSSRRAAAAAVIIARGRKVALISVAEALEHVLAHAVPLGEQEVPLTEANGRVLATDLQSRRTQPPADVSPMDGYAVRASDVASAPAKLQVIGEVPA